MCNSGYFLSYVDGLGTSYARSFLASTNARFYKKQDACSGVYSACREENGQKVDIMYNCTGRGKHEVANFLNSYYF